MKHLTTYKLFESTSESGISKSHLVDRIKWYSNFLHQYMKDINTYTSSNLNFSFSYGTELNILQIFNTVDELEHNSADGFITAICNEFITWSEYMINDNMRIASDLNEFRIDKGYVNYTDEYKKEHRHDLYRQYTYWLVYAAVGRDIKNSISGTRWDIPLKKRFTDEDSEFIIDSIISDFEVDDKYLKPALRLDGSMRLYFVNKFDVQNFTYKSVKNGIIFKIPRIKGEIITYKSDFINRLQSYFSGALILDNKSHGSSIKIYLPFYKKIYRPI